MKNVFKKNGKAIAVTTLSAVAAISMSFQSQESVEAKAQESYTLIEKLPTKEVEKSAKLKGFNAAVGAAAVTVAAVGAGVNAYNSLKGGSHSNLEIMENAIKGEQVIVSQFD